MPNTLVHIAVQGGLGRFLPANNDRWIFLGCIIPDLPWIFQRIALLAWSGVDRYDLRLYAIAQASLFFCLILSAAIALLTTNRLAVFLILSINSLLHLLLDASQIKWANGVHLWAPFSWDVSHFGLLWPEHFLFPSVSICGLFVAFLAFRRAGRSQPLFDRFSLMRTLCSVVLLVVYLGAPVLFNEQVYRSNSHFIQTLSEVENRQGQYVEFDRARYSSDADDCLTLFTGETLQCQGELTGSTSRISVRGNFLDSKTVQISDYHFHGKTRDISSYVGLLAVGALFLMSVMKAGLVASRREND